MDTQLLLTARTDSSAKRPIGVSRRRTASQSVGGGAASDAAHAPAAYLAAAVQGTRAAHILSLSQLSA